jgi:glucokinase
MILGLDIGGTSLKIGAWEPTAPGEWPPELERRSWQPDLPLPQTDVAHDVADQLAKLVKDHSAKLEQPVQALGVGSCGLIAHGTVFQSPNTPWDSLPLASLLQERLGYPVTVINDADAFLIHALRSLPDDSVSAIGLTLGTGLGTAVWLNSKLLAGGSGISPEGGHITLALDRAPANTGIPGSWESLCCASAVVHFYEEAGGAKLSDPRELKQDAEKGCPAAIAAWSQFGHFLGAGLGTLVNLFSPDYLLIGGGLSAAHELFSEPMQVALQRHKLHAFPLPEVRFLNHERDAVAHGAARYAVLQQRRTKQRQA